MSPLPKCAVVYQVSFPDGTWYIGYSKNGYKRQQEHYESSRQHNERLKKRLESFKRNQHKWKVLHYVQPEEGYEVESQIIELFWNQPGRLNLTKYRRKPKQKGMPCVVDGVQYDSIKQMSRVLFPEFSVDAVSAQVKSGCTSYSKMLFNLTINQEERKSRQVQIDGCVYDSFIQAAKALKTTPCRIRRMHEAGAQNVEEYEAYKKTKKRKPTRLHVCKTKGVWDGIEYASYSHLAKQLGWTEHFVSIMLKSGANNMDELREHVWQLWLQKAKRKNK